MLKVDLFISIINPVASCIHYTSWYAIGHNQMVFDFALLVVDK